MTTATKKMPEPIQQWIKALRSGKYEQGRERLRDGNKFCCLGVLCDISKQGKWETAYDGEEEYTSPEGACEVNLPRFVQKWAGVWSGSGLFHMQKKQVTLVNLNDVTKLNFEQIAEVIEENWESLITGSQ